MREALRSIDQALGHEPASSRLLLRRAQCLLALGRVVEARTTACAVLQLAPDDALLLDAVGTLLTRAGDHLRALEAYDRAVSLAPDTAHFIFNRATVRRYLGDLSGAERDYDRVIALRPGDHEAWLNRTELRTQTPEHNHTLELEAALARGRADAPAEVSLRFALAKEYEDLGEYEKSFAHLIRGARARRAQLRYDPAIDLATVEWIMQAYPLPPDRAPQDGERPAAAPIFILGLPRSGSTLIERILGNHPAVYAAGELPHFTQAVVAATQGLLGRPAASRRELVMQSARLDFAALGEEYLGRVRASGIEAARFIDKMPLNYLYCGLIARALPGARIVHVSRSPMAACYAIFKTLFKDGYPYSYDLQELGRYYVAYWRLMAHWRSVLPGLIHELHYEDLIADPLRASRALLEFCGLPWHEACASFHLNPAASTTASAAQVRRPLYASSVDQWRHYAHHLEPLRALLSTSGIDPEAG
jgi:tetratricopeptide (TPR) repeat protein